MGLKGENQMRAENLVLGSNIKMPHMYDLEQNIFFLLDSVITEAKLSALSKNFDEKRSLHAALDCPHSNAIQYKKLVGTGALR